MAFDQGTLLINSINKYAPPFLQKLNEDIQKEFEQLNSSLHLSLKTKTCKLCDCEMECKVMEKLATDYENRLTLLRSRCCFFYKRSYEYFKEQMNELSEQMNELSLENDALRAAYLSEKTKRICQSMTLAPSKCD